MTITPAAIAAYRHVLLGGDGAGRASSDDSLRMSVPTVFRRSVPIVFERVVPARSVGS
jgi:hypothetical protein